MYPQVMGIAVTSRNFKIEEENCYMLKIDDLPVTEVYIDGVRIPQVTWDKIKYGDYADALFTWKNEKWSVVHIGDDNFLRRSVTSNDGIWQKGSTVSIA